MAKKSTPKPEQLWEGFRLATEMGSRIQTEPMDADWRERCAQNWWGQGFKDFNQFPANQRDEMIALRDFATHLLSFGGEEVCLAHGEPDLELLKTSGVLRVGENIVSKKMRSNGCHENAFILQSTAPERYQVITGYYLSDDGMWRQHSWCWDVRKGQIVETTIPAVAYFGAVLKNHRTA